MGRRIVVAGCLALGLWAVSGGGEGEWSGTVRAQTPPLTCDRAFPVGSRGTVASRHGCWLSEVGGPGAIPWPSPNSFAVGSVVTVYRLRWDGSTPRVYCSADSSRGPDYDHWFVASAVRGATFLDRASYGVAAGSVPANDRMVSSFVGGRADRVVWERRSTYDVEAEQWVAGEWGERGTTSSPAFYRAGVPEGEVELPEGVQEETWGQVGFSCPEVGLMPRQLGDRVDGTGRASRTAPGRCLEPPAGSGELYDGDTFNVGATYLPGQGRFGDDDGDDDEEEEEQHEGENGEQEDGEQENGNGGNDDPPDLGRDDPRFDGHRSPPALPPDCDLRPGAPDCDVCQVDPLYCEWRDWEDDDGNDDGQGQGNVPEEGEGSVDEPPVAVSDLGSGRQLAEEAVVVAFSSGMACLDQESIVLNSYERQRWVDTSYSEYDALCDSTLNPVVAVYCASEGFDLTGWREVTDGYWDTWTEYRWDPNPAETNDHFPWARLFWHDGGGRSSLESGGVVMGDDGSGVCLVNQGFVRNPVLPWVVPSVTSYVAGVWSDYAGGSVGVQCPEDDGSAGLTSPPSIAGTPAPAFDATVSVDFAPAIHDVAMGEAYTLDQYRSMRDCSEWPVGETPVPGVDCGVDLDPVSPARSSRLRAHERPVSSGSSFGSITGFHVDTPAALMRHDWELLRAVNLAGRLAVDTGWDGGGDVGSGVAAAVRDFGPGVPWQDCGRRDYLMGSGADSLWGAWIRRAQAGQGAEMAASARLLGHAGGLDPRGTVRCGANGVCSPDDTGFVASHDAIFAEAETLYRDVQANPQRVCGIGDQVSPPGP